MMKIVIIAFADRYIITQGPQAGVLMYGFRTGLASRCLVIKSIVCFVAYGETVSLHDLLYGNAFVLSYKSYLSL